MDSFSLLIFFKSNCWLTNANPQEVKVKVNEHVMSILYDKKKKKNRFINVLYLLFTLNFKIEYYNDEIFDKKFEDNWLSQEFHTVFNWTKSTL